MLVGRIRLSLSSSKEFTQSMLHYPNPTSAVVKQKTLFLGIGTSNRGFWWRKRSIMASKTADIREEAEKVYTTFFACPVIVADSAAACPIVSPDGVSAH